MRYLFEDYALDTTGASSVAEGMRFPVAPQVFDLLVFLIRNRERFVSKDELIAAVWDGRIITDYALTTRLYVARNAVGDTGGNQHLDGGTRARASGFVGAVREEQKPGRSSAADISLGSWPENTSPRLTAPQSPCWHSRTCLMTSMARVCRRGSQRTW